MTSLLSAEGAGVAAERADTAVAAARPRRRAREHPLIARRRVRRKGETRTARPPPTADMPSHTHTHTLLVLACSLLVLIGLAEARKLPHHKPTEKFHQGAAASRSTRAWHTRRSGSSYSTHLCPADCWVPDYCEPEKFEYKLCRLRLRGRANKKGEYACDDDEFCEELECEHKCWLPANCTCHSEGPHVGRMLCNQEPGQKCNQHPSTQWGLCVKIPEDWDTHDDDEAMPTNFHFYTPDALLHNAKVRARARSPSALPPPRASVALAPHPPPRALCPRPCAGSSTSTRTRPWRCRGSLPSMTSCRSSARVSSSQMRGGRARFRWWH